MAEEGAPSGPVEPRREPVDTNKTKEGALEQEDYGSELEMLFGIENDHLCQGFGMKSAVGSTRNPGAEFFKKSKK